MDQPQEQEPINASASCPSCEEYIAGWKRAQADYQNLQREVDRERQNMAKYANERLLSDLLPALDQFALALAFTPDPKSLPDTEAKAWENWLIGVRAVQSLWDQAAKDAGLERISTDIPFDPNLHEAVGEEAIDGKATGEMIKVVQDGWRLHQKILRPARVTLAK